MEYLEARTGATIFCNDCLQRFFLIFEPEFSKDEDPQPRPQRPRVCPFCEGTDLEQEGKTVKDARVLSEAFLRNRDG